MFNLIQFILKIIPILSISFVFVLVVYKVYFKVRSRFSILVNCWFCNQNIKIPYTRQNDWICPKCDQYNGFNKDGDYNREIIEQLDCSNINNQMKFYTNTNLSYENFLNTNGFCETCNENQRLKIEKLSQFEPKKESNFDNEIKIYTSNLEKQYRLCPTCERHLVKVLRDKKKMVLGSKLLDFIVKGATNLTNHPQLNLIKYGKKSKLKTIIAITLLIMAIMNLFIIIHDLTDIIRKGLGKDFSDPLSKFVLQIISHMLAFIKVIQIYVDKIFKNDFIQKLYLFIRTLIFLSLTFMGIKLPKELFNGFSVISIPFGSILLAFIHSILDGFRLTRYTILLTIWSVYAGTINSEIFNEAEIFKLIISITTVILSLPQWRNYTQISMNATENSFHKIYSDYLDDSSISDSNNVSLCSNQSSTNNSSRSNNSFSSRLRTSSTLSLHKAQISPFKQFKMNEDQQSYYNRFKPIQKFPSNHTLFSSNMELNRSQLNLNNGNQHNQSFCCSATANPTNRTFTNINENDLNLSFHNSNINVQPTLSTIMTAQYRPSEINSKLSYSNNSIYNSEQNNRASLLSPSRFSITSSRFGSQPSWLSGGYFNNGQQKCNVIEKQNYFHTVPAALNSENLSRASSQSSGFESHASSHQNNAFINNSNYGIGHNGLMMGRENSCCNDFDYYSICPGENLIFQPQLQTNFNSSFNGNGQIDTFRESIAKQCISGKSLNIRPTQSPSLNCLNNSFSYSKPISVNDGFDWRQKSNRDLTTKNSFNFNKIHEELPSIQKGSLLKKYQQEQQNCFS